MSNAISELFSGTPIPRETSCGWMERQDALNQRPGKPTPPPWNWEIHDHSMATLCGGGEDAIIGHIMAISPCGACARSADPKQWKWGRCSTPSEADARLIAAAPDLLVAVMALVNQGDSSFAVASARAAIAKATGDAP